MNWPAVAAIGIGAVVIILGLRGSYQNLLGWQGAFNPNYHGLSTLGVTPPTPPVPKQNPPAPGQGG